MLSFIYEAGNALPSFARSGRPFENLVSQALGLTALTLCDNKHAVDQNQYGGPYSAKLFGMVTAS